MEKEHEILKERVLLGTKRAIDKLIIKSQKEGKELVTSETIKKSKD